MEEGSSMHHEDEEQEEHMDEVTDRNQMNMVQQDEPGADFDVELCISLMTGLGRREEQDDGTNVYVKDDDCIDCLKDLQRMLRNDDPRSRDCFRILAKHGVVRNDLVPLIRHYSRDTDLVYNALKVATFMTMPLPLAKNDATAYDDLINGMRPGDLARFAEAQQDIKAAFLQDDALAVVMNQVIKPLERHPRMNDKDRLIVQLVLTFLRNLLRIPDASTDAGSRDHHKTRLREQLLGRFFDDNIMDLLLAVASYAQQSPFRSEAPLIQELMLLVIGTLDLPALLAAQTTPPAAGPASIAGDASQRVSGSSVGKQGQQQGQARKRLPALVVDKEKAYLLEQRRRMREMTGMASTRHAHFGATYVRRSDDAAGAPRAVLLEDAKRIDLGGPTSVARRKLHGNGRAARAENKDASQGTSAAAARLSPGLLVRLRAMMDSFLEGPYGVLMGQMRKELAPGLHVSRLETEDFVNFLLLARVCTQYVRLKTEASLKAQLAAARAAKAAAAAAADGGISASASPPPPIGLPEGESPFAPISATMGHDTFHLVQMLWHSQFGARPADVDWRVQHAPVTLLREMLMVLDLASAAGTPEDKAAADRLQRRLLHDDSSDTGLVNVIKSLLKCYNSRYQPRSAAVDLVEVLHVVLRMLQRLCTREAGGFIVRRQKKATGGGGGRRKQQTPPHDAEADQQQRDGDGSENVAADANGEPAAEPTAGTAAAEGTTAHPGEQQDAGSGAAAGGGVEVAGSGVGNSPVGGEGSAAAGSGEGSGEPERRRVNVVAEVEEEEAAADRRRRAVVEVALDFNKRLTDLADAKVVQLYNWLLGGYRTNGQFLNHCLVSFLDRIAHPTKGQNLEPMLYQVSVLRTLHAVLADPSIRKDPQFAELLQFSTRVVRGLFSRLVPALPDKPQLSPAGGATATTQGPSPSLGLANAADAAAAEGAGGPAAEVALGGEGGGAAAAAHGGDSGDGGEAGSGGDEGGEGEMRARGEDEDAEVVGGSKREVTEADVKEWEAECECTQETSRVLFLEMLFWKGPKVAEYVRDGYKWQDLFDDYRAARDGMPSGGGSGGGSGEMALHRGDALGDEDADLEGNWARPGVGGGGGARAVPSSRKDRQQRSIFTPEQLEELTTLFEEHGARRDWLDAITTLLAGGVFKRSQVQRQLKAMGLKRGSITQNQATLIRSLHEQHQGTRDCVMRCVIGAGNVWTKPQMLKHLKNLGLWQGRKKKTGDKSAAGGQGGGPGAGAIAGLMSSGDSEGDDGDDAAVSGSDDDSDDGSSGSSSDDGSGGGVDGDGRAAVGGGAGAGGSSTQLQHRNEGRRKKKANVVKPGGRRSALDSDSDGGGGGGGRPASSGSSGPMVMLTSDSEEEEEECEGGVRPQVGPEAAAPPFTAPFTEPGAALPFTEPFSEPHGSGHAAPAAAAAAAKRRSPEVGPGDHRREGKKQKKRLRKAAAPSGAATPWAAADGEAVAGGDAPQQGLADGDDGDVAADGGAGGQRPPAAAPAGLGAGGVSKPARKRQRRRLEKAAAKALEEEDEEDGEEAKARAGGSSDSDGEHNGSGGVKDGGASEGDGDDAGLSEAARREALQAVRRRRLEKLKKGKAGGAAAAADGEEPGGLGSEVSANPTQAFSEPQQQQQAAAAAALQPHTEPSTEPFTEPFSEEGGGGSDQENETGVANAAARASDAQPAAASPKQRIKKRKKIKRAGGGSNGDGSKALDAAEERQGDASQVAVDDDLMDF